MKKRGWRVIAGVLLAVVILAEVLVLVSSLQGKNPMDYAGNWLSKITPDDRGTVIQKAKTAVNNLLSLARPDEMKIVSNLAAMGIIVLEMPQSTNQLGSQLASTNLANLRDTLEAVRSLRIVGVIKLGDDWKCVLAAGQKNYQLAAGSEFTLPYRGGELKALCESVSADGAAIRLPNPGVKIWVAKSPQQNTK